MNREEKKQYLAQLNFCRSFLYLGHMITEAESHRIHAKICRYQDKNRIEISYEELGNVEIVYSSPDLLNSEQNPEECDATEADSSTGAGNQIEFPNIPLRIVEGL